MKNEIFTNNRTELIQWGAAIIVGIILIGWDTSPDKNDEMQKQINELKQQLQQCHANGAAMEPMPRSGL